MPRRAPVRAGLGGDAPLAATYAIKGRQTSLGREGRSRMARLTLNGESSKPLARLHAHVLLDVEWFGCRKELVKLVQPNLTVVIKVKQVEQPVHDWLRDCAHDGHRDTHQIECPSGARAAWWKEQSD